MTSLLSVSTPPFSAHILQQIGKGSVHRCEIQMHRNTLQHACGMLRMISGFLDHERFFLPINRLSATPRNGDMLCLLRLYRKTNARLDENAKHYLRDRGIRDEGIVKHEYGIFLTFQFLSRIFLFS
ncbi:hypothetical protein KIN20_019021 [Parelaphostrongylus tenuis]|uniref:Uncharacterized protein n=1 Tax=Parelaphostrongylus tenuis TaxID=148309 RepID=A0AAD5MQW4_PARTN|nr:hypothetical protein KIN20_019021 [Parelaphostrongylus tenuis]